MNPLERMKTRVGNGRESVDERKRSSRPQFHNFPLGHLSTFTWTIRGVLRSSGHGTGFRIFMCCVATTTSSTSSTRAVTSPYSVGTVEKHWNEIGGNGEKERTNRFIGG